VKAKNENLLTRARTREDKMEEKFRFIRLGVMQWCGNRAAHIALDESTFLPKRNPQRLLMGVADRENVSFW